MYTQCPFCRTLFRITQEQMDAADGKVRCGECHKVFRATDHLHQSIIPAATDTAASPPTTHGPGAEIAGQAQLPEQETEAVPETGADAEPAPKPERVLEAATQPEETALGEAPDTRDDHSSVQPPSPPATPRTGTQSRSPAELSRLSIILAEDAQPPRRGPLATVLWLAGCLLLLATLALQYVYFQRNILVAQADWRPLVELLCQYADCELPPQRDLSTFILLDHDIRSHEQYQGALTISATLQNRADYAQPYPEVEVTMHDLGGKVVAARRFHPAEYLTTAPAGVTLMESQATAQLLLDIVDPGPEAVGFEFTFH